MALTSILLDQIKSDVKDDMEAILLYFLIGSDNTAATAGDTEMGAEILRRSIDSVDKSGGSTIVASGSVPVTLGNDSSIVEIGWGDEAETLVDGCDAIAGWSDNVDMTTHLNNTTFWQGTGSIDLTKDAGGGVVASTAKTTPSLDFTNNFLSLIIYVKDATMLAKLAVSNAVVVRFGSGSGNYYQWNFDLADLAVGKNVLTMLSSANADSTTGTPVLTEMDYTYIGIEATGAAVTWSDGDLIMDYIKIFGGNLWMRNIVIEVDKTDDIALYADTTTTITITES